MLRPGRHQSRSIACIAAALALCGALPALSFETKTATIGNTLEIDASIEHEMSADKRRWEMPLEITLPVTPWMNFDIEQKLAVAEDRDGTHVGLTNVEMAAKVRLLNGRDNAWGLMLGVKPMLELPTGTRRVTDRAWGIEIPVFGGRKFGRTGAFAQVEYKRTLGRDNARYAVSTLVTRDISERFVIGAEAQGKIPERRTSDYTLETNIGFKWQINPQVGINGEAGRTLRTPDGRPVKSFKLEFKFEL